MSVEDLLLPMCAKVLNLCDVVNDRYQLYILHLVRGDLCLRHDIYRQVFARGKAFHFCTQLDWGPSSRL